ncbi:MAG: Rne/Rng family ribonuclease, partial [Gammaproteobacteria bacterium]|nr:Rne/Rng family ribonuclease [Gammaproteobacteria bacterium]
VVRVLPGMQAAFVDIGLSKAAFIHVKELVPYQDREPSPRPASDENPTISDGGAQSNIKTRQSNLEEPQPSITGIIKESDEVVVQVIKDMIGSKGARLTTHLSIPSRYFVYMPTGNHVGVSQRISDEPERERLRSVVEGFKQGALEVKGGFILRTAAEGVDEEELNQDLEFLLRLWQYFEKRLEVTHQIEVLFEGLPLLMRTVRDLSNENIEKIRIDREDSYAKVVDFTRQFVPKMTGRIEHYRRERPLFDLYNIEEEIQKALQRKVVLKSGGYLVFDQTEAMTTIDVNTGAFVGKRNLEETIFKTNLEAAHGIARQLKLRNLGGIIIVDFIDMEEENHRQQVLRAFEKALEKDYAKNKISGVSELGLVEMSRKRTSESLEHLLCESCPTCENRGSIKTAETVCYEVFREILRSARAYEAQTILVIASQSVVDRLLDEESANVADIEQHFKRTIKFQVETMYNQELFDVVLL